MISTATRSKIMASIPGKNTRPELIVRKSLHHKGFRYRIHEKRLPGTPDLSLPKYKVAIQINGCFWHGHSCPSFRPPQHRREYWQSKIEMNKTRDRKNNKTLLNMGWRLMVIWECAIQGPRRIDLDILMSIIENWILVGNDYIEIEGSP